jgi:hypothetical protein
MICPIVEQAHFGTTRYTMLSLSVIQVPGNPILRASVSAAPILGLCRRLRGQKTKLSVFIQSEFLFI